MTAKLSHLTFRPKFIVPFAITNPERDTPTDAATEGGSPSQRQERPASSAGPKGRIWRVLVVGAGAIAKQHLSAIAELENARCVGVCDLSPVSAEAAAERFGATAWFTDLSRALEAVRPDAVHVATPAASHFYIASACIRAGCHVLVEKPLAVSPSECESLLHMAAEHGVRLVEDHNYLFNTAVLECLGRVERGELGSIRHTEVQVCLDVFGAASRFSDATLPHPSMADRGSVVSDFLPHLCYLARAFSGVDDVAGAAWALSGPPGREHKAEFTALLTGPRGTATIGFSSSRRPNTFELRVHGSRGRFETNLFEAGAVAVSASRDSGPLTPIIDSVRRACGELSCAGRSLSRKLSGGPGAYEGLWRLVRDFYATLGSPDTPITPDALAATDSLRHKILATAPPLC